MSKSKLTCHLWPVLLPAAFLWSSLDFPVSPSSPPVSPDLARGEEGGGTGGGEGDTTERDK